MVHRSRDVRDSALAAGKALRLRRSDRRHFYAFVVALLAVLATAVITAPSASAATYGWVYISTPTWQGNCNWGSNGRVSGLHLTVVDSWQTPTAGDWGGDLVYARVRLNQSQQVAYSAFCNKWPGSWQAGISKTIRPTRNNQTVWIGPAGVRYN